MSDPKQATYCTRCGSVKALYAEHLDYVCMYCQEAARKAEKAVDEAWERNRG
jgi:late competence protein required for DNA uptake (superfamily II DNA/RNA helicase)